MSVATGVASSTASAYVRSTAATAVLREQGRWRKAQHQRTKHSERDFQDDQTAGIPISCWPIHFSTLSTPGPPIRLIHSTIWTLCRTTWLQRDWHARSLGEKTNPIYFRTMIPFLHSGSLTIPTYGLMVALAMLTAYFALRADLDRRGVAPKSSSLAETLIAVPCLAGLVGAKLYHELESPHDLFADPWHHLFSQFGFAWFGGMLAGFAAYVWVSRKQRAPLLSMLDAGSPAAALGYGIGRIGCLLSGDGDYGIPTSLPWGMSFPNGLVPTMELVHPTPIYEFIASCVIAWLLWRMGGKHVAE